MSVLESPGLSLLVGSTLLLLGLGTACVPKSKAPPVERQAPRTLEPGAPGRAAPPSGRLRVVHTAPKGPVGNEQQIAVVFDRSLRPLVAGESAVPAIQLEPQVAGKWDWVGTQALVFTPASRFFPQGTSFRVTVPAGLTALDRTTLDKPVSFRFETRRPIARFLGEDGEDEGWRDPSRPKKKLGIDEPVRIRFDVPVALEALRKALRIRGPGGQPAFELKETEAANHRDFQIHPAPAWPLGGLVWVIVDGSLGGIEGPLPAGREVACRRAIHGAPRFELQCELRGTRCSMQESVRIVSENPVDTEALAHAVQILPRTRIAALDYSVRFEGLKARTRYHVELGGGLAGKYGGASKAQQFDFETGDPVPALRMDLESGSIEPKLLGPVTVGIEHATNFGWAARSLEPAELFGLAFASEELPSPLDGRYAYRRVTLDPEGTYLEQRDLRAVLGPDQEYGAVLVGVSTEQADQPDQERLIQVTDLGVTSKLSPEGGLVWVTRLSDTAPVARASVSLVSEGRAVPLGETDSSGVLVLGPEVARVWSTLAMRRVRAPRLVGPVEQSPTPPCSKHAPAETAAAAAALSEIAEDAGLGLYVRHGSDWTVQPLKSNGLLDSQQLGGSFIRSVEPPKELVAVLTDRDPYRPGDIVHIKGVLRQETSSTHRVLANEPVRVRLSGPGYASTGNQILCTNDWGGFSASLKLPADGPRGRWTVSASGPAGDESAQASFYVTDYRPTEFSASLTGPDSMVMGKPTTFRLKGEYLSGEPLAGATATSVFDVEHSSFVPPGAGRAVTHAYQLDRYPGYEVPKLVTPPGDIRLDAQGRAELEWVRRANLLGPIELELEATVFDAARQTVATRAKTVIHPGEFYLALEWQGRATVGEAVPFGVRSLSPGGARVTGTKVEVSLLRQDGRGREAKLDEEDRCVLTTGGRPASCRLVAHRQALYFLHARATDTGGRLVQAADSQFVFARPLAAPAARWYPWDRRGLEGADLRLDRALYHVGDKAKLAIASPYRKARALITLQRSKIYWRTERVVGPKSVVEIPVLPAMGRNASVEVVLLREPGRAQATCPSNRAVEPIAAWGNVRLEVDPDDWRLALEVRPERDSARPGESVPIEVMVTDRRGRPRPAEVTLWAVDEGVLLLRDYQTPDWLPQFTQLRADETTGFETRAALGWILLPPVPEQSALALGHGTGTAGGIPVLDPAGFAGRSARSRGDPTPLFLPHLRTDPQGKARADLRLQGQLSRYRVMAVAHTLEGQFGTGESSVRARLPLWARPALPRFLRVGDEAEAGVVVSGELTEPTEVTVHAEARGLELAEPPTRKLTLRGHRAENVSFRWRATQEGQARLRFDVRSSEATDTVEERIRITHAIGQQTTALYGQTQTARSERLGDLSGLDPGRSRLELGLADTALGGLGGSFEDLMGYPYECSEQLVGRLLALGGLSELRKLAQGSFPPYRERDYEQILGILSRRREYGGFKFWDDPHEQPSVWLTAYVLWGFQELERAGKRVPEDMARGAERFLDRALADRDSPIAPDVVAFVLDVLSSTGKRPVTPEQWAKCEAVDSLPLFAQAHLLHAAPAVFKPYSPSDPRTPPLVKRIESALRLSGNQAYAEADHRYPRLSAAADRTTALVLRALLAHDASHPLLSALARGLLGMRRGSGWSSTQATAQALVALEDYRRAVDNASAQFVAHAWLGPKRLLEASFSPDANSLRLLQVPGSSLVSNTDLVFEKKGQGTLYYTARLTYAPRELPRVPVGHGFSLEHWIAPMTDPSELPSGMQPFGAVPAFDVRTPLLGEVLVITPVRRNQVVIDVALPAGFEPIDPVLTTSPRALLQTASDWLDMDEDARRRIRISMCPEGHCLAVYPAVVREQAGDVWNERAWYHRGLVGPVTHYRQEIRDDGVVFFVDEMPPGL
ncbi:MAG: hypothetical protein JW940_03200, partial [Polyangiaceae bacterium]|nr:hypothetical protein [Polyangiaceae bacterium]